MPNYQIIRNKSQRSVIGFIKLLLISLFTIVMKHNSYTFVTFFKSKHYGIYKIVGVYR